MYVYEYLGMYAWWVTRVVEENLDNTNNNYYGHMHTLYMHAHNVIRMCIRAYNVCMYCTVTHMHTYTIIHTSYEQGEWHIHKIAWIFLAVTSIDLTWMYLKLICLSVWNNGVCDCVIERNHICILSRLRKKKVLPKEDGSGGLYRSQHEYHLSSLNLQLP